MSRTVIPNPNLPMMLERIPRGILDKAKRMAICGKESTIIYTDQTQIPNFLKMSTTARKVIIAYSSENETRPIDLQMLIATTLRYVMHVHIAEGKVNVASRNRSDRSNKETPDTILMDWRQSWEFSSQLMKNRKIILRPVRLPLVLVIEILQRETCPYPRSFGFITNETLALIEQEGSVVWDNTAEIVFLATRFAYHERTPCVVHIALLSDGGGMEMDMFVCPRHIITNYGTHIHNLHEKDLIRQTDEYVAYDSLRIRLQNKIVVGYSIHEQLENLHIDLTELAGIREIKTNPCFGTQAMSNYNWTIQRLAAVYVKRPIGFPIADAYEEVTVVRDLYLARERYWIDDNDLNTTS